MIDRNRDTPDLADHTLQVGDRVLIYARANRSDEGRFGRIEQFGTYLVYVQLEKGPRVGCEPSLICYAPSTAEIAAKCELIRESWSFTETRTRAGLAPLRTGECEHVEIQVVPAMEGCS